MSENDSNPKEAVSGSRHKPKKKRDWKAINSKRRPAIGAKARQISRYQVEELRRVRRIAGDEFDARSMRAELTVPQVLKIIEGENSLRLPQTRKSTILR